MKKPFLLAAALFYALCAHALTVTSLPLSRCESDALAFSPKLKQYQAQTDAAQSAYQASRSTFYPTLSLDAQGSWVSEVPSLEMGPLKASFGDNWGYSAGPTVSYVLFDNGGRSDVSKSARSAASAKEQEARFARKQTLLQVRQAYFTVQQDLQRLHLLYGQLTVSRKQLADVQAAFDAGAKSKLDVYMANKQVLKAQTNISAARGALGAHLRELFQLTGTDYGINPLYPLDWRLADAKLDGLTTALIQTDSPANTLKRLASYADGEFDENSPRLAALENMAEYYDYLADSYRSSLYPRLSVHGGAYFEYPNGPIKEHVFLGRAGAALSIPLFEGGQSRRQSDAQRHSARAARYERQDAQNTLEKLFYSSKDRLYSLLQEERLTRRMIEDARQTAALTYQAYRAGAVTFFDVDNANLGLLESQIALSDLQTNQLNNLAVINSLSKENL